MITNLFARFEGVLDEVIEQYTVLFLIKITSIKPSSNFLLWPKPSEHA